MLVLGIESTCDETGFAVVRNGKEILSNCVASQIDLHQKYGGVVPELACRRHIEVLPELLREALCVPLESIDLIAVAKGPGLIGALLIGLNFAKGLALSLAKPLVGVNHVEAHLYAPFITHHPLLPALGVVVSGGHTLLVKIEEIGDYRLIGQTQDDAIGEAFDKVAKLLNLPYPGGPHIENLAKQGNPHCFAFKSGQVKGRPFDLSFSGLKTAVFYLIKKESGNNKADVAASFQHIAFMGLVEKILCAAKVYQCRSIVLGGGASQNQYFREKLNALSPLPVFWPPLDLCLDNAAMIAGLGFHIYRQKGCDGMDLDASPRLPLHEVQE